MTRPAGNRPPGPFLADELVRVRDGDRLSLHMPGHKGGRGASILARETLGEAAFAADVSEMGGYDYLHAPQGAMADAQRAAADEFGSGRTFFLVNGSTVGNQAAIMGTCRDGDMIVMPRGSHRSVYAGCVLAGAVPRYVPIGYDAIRDGWFAADIASFAHLGLGGNLAGSMRAVHVTRPNYYGMACDLAPWLALARAHDAVLIVDEAHGSHFGRDPRLPASALSLGADIVIQSTHKTLGALTQSSMLHVGHDAIATGCVDTERLAHTLQMLQSSSPSALLTISLDLARAALRDNPFGGVVDLAVRLRAEIDTIASLATVATDDPTKVVVDVTGLAMTGFDAADVLRSACRLWVELADFRRVVVSVTVGDSVDSIDMVADAFRSLTRGPLPNRRSGSPSPGPPGITIPEMVLAPRQADHTKTRPVALEHVLGEVIGEYVIPYPPGIPLLVPGERIDTSAMDALTQFLAAGCRIVGPFDPDLRELRVLVR